MRPHLTLALLALLSAILFVSCFDKGNDPDAPDDPSFNEEKIILYAYADQFMVLSEPMELDNWTIDTVFNDYDSNHWMIPEWRSGSAGEKVAFMLQANITGENRSIEALLSGYDSKKNKVTRKIEIQQSPLDENGQEPSLRLSNVLFIGHPNFFYVRDTDLTKTNVQVILNGEDLGIKVIDAHNASFEVPDKLIGLHLLTVILGDKKINYGFANVYRWEASGGVEELPVSADFADNSVMVTLTRYSEDWYNVLLDKNNNETPLYLRNSEGRIVGGALMYPTFLCDGYLSCDVKILNRRNPYRFNPVYMTVSDNGSGSCTLIANTRTGRLFNLGKSKKVLFSSKDEKEVTFLVYSNDEYEMLTITDDGHTSTRKLKGVNAPVGYDYPVVAGNIIQTSENWIFNGDEMVMPKPLSYSTEYYKFHEGDGYLSKEFIILPFKNDLVRFSKYSTFSDLSRKWLNEVDLRSAVYERYYFHTYWDLEHDSRLDYDAFVYTDHAVFRPCQLMDEGIPPQPLVSITKNDTEKLMPTEDEWKYCIGNRLLINHSSTRIYNGGDFGYYKTGERFRISSFETPVKLKNFPEKYFSAIVSPRGLYMGVFTEGDNLSIYHYNTDTDTPEITVLKSYKEYPYTTFSGWINSL